MSPCQIWVEFYLFLWSVHPSLKEKQGWVLRLGVHIRHFYLHRLIINYFTNLSSFQRKEETNPASVHVKHDSQNADSRKIADGFSQGMDIGKKRTSKQEKRDKLECQANEDVSIAGND